MTDRTIINDRTILRTGERGPRGPKGADGLGGGVTDHGALTGLADDDHPQYLLAAAAAEFIRDAIGTALVAGANITLTVNDAGDTITVAMPGAAFETAGAVAAHAGAADPHPTYTTAAELLTALSAYLTSSAAPELIRDTMGTALVAGANITLTVNDAGDTITVAAAGGGIFTRTAFPSTLQGLAVRYAGIPFALVADRILFVPLVLQVPCTINAAGVWVTTGAGSTTVKLGIYSANASTGMPSTLLVSGSVDSSSSGKKTGSLTATSLAAGLYYVGVMAAGGTPSVYGIDPGGYAQFESPYYSTGPDNLPVALNIIKVATASGVLDSSISSPSISSVSMPNVFVTFSSVP